MATTLRLTAEDLLALPDHQRGDLIEGMLRPMPPANFDHFNDTGRLILRVGSFVEAHGLGVVGAEGGFRLQRDPDTVLAPDVAYVRQDRLPPPGQRAGFPDLAPDLAVEVLSPSNTPTEVARKVAIYLAAGTGLVWVVDRPRRTVTVHRTGRPPRTVAMGGVLEGEDVLPGFALPLAELFA